MFARYSKAIAPFVALVVLILSTEVGADSKWVTYAIALAAALGVVAAPANKPAA